jgi:hypothetical protein
MRTALLEQVRSEVLTEGTKAAAENFIINEASYQELLNLSYNPDRESELKPIEEMEKVAMESYAAVLQEGEKEMYRKSHIGSKDAEKYKGKKVAKEATTFAEVEGSAEVVEEAKKTMKGTSSNKLNPSIFKRAGGAMKKAGGAVGGVMKKAGSAIASHPKTSIGVGAGLAGLGTAAALAARRKKQESVEETTVTEADDDKGSVAGSALKGAALGGAAGVTGKVIRRATSKPYQKAAQKAIGGVTDVAIKHIGEPVSAGKIPNVSKYMSAAQKAPGMAKLGKMAKSVKYGGKWGRIGAGVGAVGLGTAAALAARRRKEQGK